MDERDASRIQSFDEFWVYYVGEHRHPLCRALHYAGTSAALGTVAAALLTKNPKWLLATAFAGYGPAWVSHFFVENNKPATFKYPVWSLLADFKMLSLALQGKMADEVARLYGSSFPAPDAPRMDPSAGGSPADRSAGKAPGRGVAGEAVPAAGASTSA